MDFEATSAQREARDRALAFAARIAPSADERDRERRWDPALWRELAAAGLAGALLPAGHGGGGLDALTFAALQEGFGAGGEDAGLAAAWSAHLLGCAVPIWRLGTEAQQRRFLPALAGGSIGALAHHETHLEGHPLGVRTSAARRGDTWRLCGTKRAVTNAPVAGLFLVTAVTDRGLGPAGVSSFLVERDRAGLDVGPPRDGFALRTAPVADLILVDCEVPDEQRLGREGSGLDGSFALAERWRRALALGPWIGLAQSLLDRCLSHLRRGSWLGRPLAQSQAARTRLADLRIRWELARRVQARAAWQLVHPAETGGPDAAAAHLFLAESARAITAEAVHLLVEDDGAAALAQRLHRDAVALAAEGRDLERSTVAGALLGLG